MLCLCVVCGAARKVSTSQFFEEMVFVFQLIFRSNSTLSQSNSRGTQTVWSGADVLLLRKRPRFRGVWIFPPPQIASQTLVIVLIFVSCDVSDCQSKWKVIAKWIESSWCLQGRVLPVRWHCQWRPPDSGGSCFGTADASPPPSLYSVTSSWGTRSAASCRIWFYFLARHFFNQIIFCRTGIEF